MLKQKCEDCGKNREIRHFQKRENGVRRRKCNKCLHLKIRYGISGRKFMAMLKYQMRSCLICEKKINEDTAVVDHCHDELQVRGLLCRTCNSGIAHLKHDKDVAYRAFEFLRKFN